MVYTTMLLTFYPFEAPYICKEREDRLDIHRSFHSRSLAQSLCLAHPRSPIHSSVVHASSNSHNPLTEQLL